MPPELNGATMLSLGAADRREVENLRLNVAQGVRPRGLGHAAACGAY
jgi:hypothetical protein